MILFKESHHLSVENLREQLQTTENGLSETEVKKRLSMYGVNALPSVKKISWLTRLATQFNNILIYLLSIAIVLSLFLKRFADACVIGVVILIDGIIGFIQESKAQTALAAVQKMLIFNATVIREGKKVTIPAEHLVPGDIVLLEPGDKVPADLRMMQVKGLEINEALLTGESLPVSKCVEILPADISLADRTNMAFFGTLVTRGQGMGMVVNTGIHTQIGQIHKLLGAIPPLTSPLLVRMHHFARKLGLTIVGVAMSVFAFGLWVRHYPLEQMIMTAVGIAVALIPEGLPIMLTVALAVGVRRMAHQHAIIRRLAAVEMLGAITTICTDKTGTLTQNEMTVEVVYTGKGPITVSGIGYHPTGQFYYQNQNITPTEHLSLKLLCQAALLCNEAALHLVDEHYELYGDPTDGALLVLGLKAHLPSDFKNYSKIDVLPFEPEFRLTATLYQQAHENVIFVKGAPETLLTYCTHEQQDNKIESLNLSYWQEQIHILTNKGQRAIALAYKSVPHEHNHLSLKDVQSELILLGIVAISDPPRKEVPKALHECQSAGIHTKIITGDHPTTATAIAMQLGIGGKTPTVITGDQLNAMTDEALTRIVSKVDIFARASAEHKLRVVQALQSNHECVVMTGDGVNDAPALKRADIGVAMGLKGSEAAKEAAEMVLTDDNFASIVDAIKEGRTVLTNLKKVILFLLPMNGGEAISLVVATLLGYTLPITPIQILWINMVSSLTLTMSLAFSPTDASAMQRPPTPQQTPLLSPLLWWQMGFISLVFLISIMGIFIWALDASTSLATARTLALNTLVVLEVSYLWSIRFDHISFNKRNMQGIGLVLKMTGLVLVLQAVLTYLPWMQTIFGTTALTINEILCLMAIGFTGLILFEMNKRFFNIRPTRI